LVVGLLVGLTLALGVALYMTKAPIPFVDKVPLRTGESEAEEAARNKDWNPNAPLASKVPRPAPPAAERDMDAPAAEAAAPGAPPAAAPGSPAARDPAAILSGAPVPAPAGAAAKSGAGAASTGVGSGASGAPAAPTSAAAVAPAVKAPGATAEGFVYFVQAGAFVQVEDAQAQRAKLAMIGLEARVFAREQAGRTVHRVRVGPFDAVAEAEAARERLAKAGLEATLVRMDRAAAVNQ
jgi:cell division protein FtsN